MTSQQPDTVLACNLHAIPRELLPAHQANAQRIFSSIQAVQELPRGYALRLPNETDLLQTVMAFITYERLCCPFFHFGLEIEPQQGPIWLRLSGTEDVKFFLQSQEWFATSPT